MVGRGIRIKPFLQFDDSPILLLAVQMLLTLQNGYLADHCPNGQKYDADNGMK